MTITRAMAPMPWPDGPKETWSLRTSPFGTKLWTKIWISNKGNNKWVPPDELETATFEERAFPEPDDDHMSGGHLKWCGGSYTATKPRGLKQVSTAGTNFPQWVFLVAVTPPSAISLSLSLLTEAKSVLTPTTSSSTRIRFSTLPTKPQENILQHFDCSSLHRYPTARTSLRARE